MQRIFFTRRRRRFRINQSRVDNNWFGSVGPYGRGGDRINRIVLVEFVICERTFKTRVGKKIENYLKTVYFGESSLIIMHPFAYSFDTELMRSPCVQRVLRWTRFIQSDHFKNSSIRYFRDESIETLRFVIA